MVLAIGGVVLFAYSDGFTAANIEGVLLTLGAAVGAAVYKVWEGRGRMGRGGLFCVQGMCIDLFVHAAIATFSVSVDVMVLCLLCSVCSILFAK